MFSQKRNTSTHYKKSFLCFVKSEILAHLIIFGIFAKAKDSRKNLLYLP